jgi:hypothetical protein
MRAIYFCAFIATLHMSASAVRAQTGEFKVLYSFTGGSDGANPMAGLRLGKGGVLYEPSRVLMTESWG